jgi:hypothetical protein
MDTVKRRKSQYRLSQRLSNGQLLKVFISRRKGLNRVYQWHVGVFIGNSHKQANKWYNHNSKRTKDQQTGNCGLEGLNTAMKIILNFVQALQMNEELIVFWTDQKRQRAYKRLKKYGFIDYEDEEGNVIAYGMRNPELWEPIGGSEMN